jgi:hypothetical protein
MERINRCAVIFVLVICLVITFTIMIFLKREVANNLFKYPIRTQCPSIDALYVNQTEAYLGAAKADRDATRATNGGGYY